MKRTHDSLDEVQRLRQSLREAIPGQPNTIKALTQELTPFMNGSLKGILRLHLVNTKHSKRSDNMKSTLEVLKSQFTTNITINTSSSLNPSELIIGSRRSQGPCLVDQLLEAVKEEPPFILLHIEGFDCGGGCDNAKIGLFNQLEPLLLRGTLRSLNNKEQSEFRLNKERTSLIVVFSSSQFGELITDPWKDEDKSTKMVLRVVNQRGFDTLKMMSLTSSSRNLIFFGAEEEEKVDVLTPLSPLPPPIDDEDDEDEGFIRCWGELQGMPKSIHYENMEEQDLLSDRKKMLILCWV